MKKIFAMILALTMSFALVSCGGNSATSSGAGSADDGTLKLAEPGVLTMGTNATFPPYEFYEGDKIVGIDTDLSAAIAEKLGLELKVVDMEFGALIGAVQSGKIDMCLAGMTVDPERAKNVDFSDSYATGIQAVIVAEGSDITSVDDLNAKLEAGEDFLIGTQESTTGYIYSSSAPEDGGFGEEHVIAFSAGAAAVQALQQGKVDCVIIDIEPAKAFVEANEGLKLLDTEYVSEDYAIALPKDNAALQDAVNNALAELIEDGTVQKILDQYIKAD